MIREMTYASPTFEFFSFSNEDVILASYRVQKIKQQEPKTVEVEQILPRTDDFDLTEKGKREYQKEVDEIVNEFLENRFELYSREIVVNIRKMETGNFKKFDYVNFFAAETGILVKFADRLHRVLKKITGKVDPDNSDYALFEKLFLSKYDNRNDAKNEYRFTFVLVRNSQLTKIGEFFVDRLKQQVKIDNFDLMFKVHSKGCDVGMFLKEN